MINYDSILSAFDGKPTLLQWLKMVKKALDESVLKNVDITQNGEKVVFSFNFEDGTSISTPEVTLPKGDKGDAGENGVSIVRIETVGSNVVGVNTESTISVELSDGSVKQFKTYAKNGRDGLNGNDGVSITGIDTVSDEVVGNETLTTLRAHYSNETFDEFVVTAKNGEVTNIYRHLISLIDESNNILRFIIDSKYEAIDIDIALSQVPSLNGVISFIIKDNNKGIVSVVKDNNILNFFGFIYNEFSASIEKLEGGFVPVSVNDILIGVNL